jgi:hypothetical protein
MTYATRDDWLAAATENLFRSEFQALGFPLPAELRASVGFPSRGAASTRNQTLGQCWDGKHISDGITQVYISPVLIDPVKVLETLGHELVHAAVGSECGHKGNFRKCAKALGLEGKMTATHAGERLAERLQTLADKLGPFPHAQIDLSASKTQGTRMLKVECDGCAYAVRMTRKMVTHLGYPVCPGCHESMTESV